MTTTRESFVARFGEDQAVALENACDYHLVNTNWFDEIIGGPLFGDTGHGHASDNRGSDPFQYVVMAALGHECVSRFAEFHHITFSELEFDEWIMTSAHLETYDGDPPDNLHALITKLGGIVPGSVPDNIVIVNEKEKPDD